jgi:hypothetical protein
MKVLAGSGGGGGDEVNPIVAARSAAPTVVWVSTVGSPAAGDSERDPDEVKEERLERLEGRVTDQRTVREAIDAAVTLARRIRPSIGR